MKIMKYLIAGTGIGFICTTFFMIMFIGFNPLTAQILAWLIASAIYGLSTMIFDNQKLRFFYKIIIHYIIALSVTLCIIYLFYQPYVISVLISFTITYIIVLYAVWQIEKNNIKKLNEKLKENNMI